MKWLRWLIGLMLVCALAPLALAQSNQSDMDAATGEHYVPRLGDIMNAVQTRHIKLWFAGKALNWELATFELRQLKAGLLQAAVMYTGIPVTNVTTMSKPVQSIADAITAKDIKRFSQAVHELTNGCDACHQSMGRGFIIIGVPTEQPFSDQLFTPQAKP
jgi:hypothetical protein